MRSDRLRAVIAAAFMLLLFCLFTLAVATVDVQPIGPNGSSVGLATLNGAFTRLVGTNSFWYHVSELLGIFMFLVPLCFAALGLYQLIRRRNPLKIDPDLLLLGVFYVVVIACYVAFDHFIINYRPVLIDGVLEPAYPSSHTMISLSVMGSAILQVRRRFPRTPLCRLVTPLLSAIMIITAMARALSGVHWLTDIVGGVLLAATLTLFYRAAICGIRKKR